MTIILGTDTMLNTDPAPGPIGDRETPWSFIRYYRSVIHSPAEPHMPLPAYQRWDGREKKSIVVRLNIFLVGLRLVEVSNVFSTQTILYIYFV